MLVEKCFVCYLIQRQQQMPLQSEVAGDISRTVVLQLAVLQNHQSLDKSNEEDPDRLLISIAPCALAKEGDCEELRIDLLRQPANKFLWPERDLRGRERGGFQQGNLLSRCSVDCAAPAT